jgi:hypothetical protein
MKNLAKITVLAFAALSFTFASCNSKPAENAESAAGGAVDAAGTAVDAAGAELDSATTPTEGYTALVKDQPVQDGVIDSTATK